MFFASTLLRTATFLLASLALAVPAGAQTPAGTTLSPDRQSFLVSKDLLGERWTINLNLFSPDPSSVISATGNIFRPDGGPASFVTCLVRADSTGTLTDPNSVFRFSCSGTDACPTTATSCARDSWTLISNDVQVPASFFLPPGGLGTPPPQLAAQAAAERDVLLLAGYAPPRAPAVDAGLVDRFLAALSRAASGVRAWIVTHRTLDFARPRAAHAQATSDRGATLTPDQLSLLVTKDVGPERWSISYSFEPALSESGLIVNRLLSITGNVYQPDGTPPQFVYCTVLPDSAGTLDDPSSEYRLGCSVALACQTTAEECAQTGWQPVAEPVVLQASFFLPPGGLPAPPQSDPEILVIGRTSDPPSIVVPLGAESGAAADRPAGACPTGSECTVDVLGSCEDVPGVVVDIAGFGCGCQITDPDPACITCGGGASGTCGAPCEYQVSAFTARGTCLPFDYESEECACYAIGAGAQQAVEGCGGVLAASCPDPSSGCCAADPRGSCDPQDGLIACPGICVPGEPGCFTGGD